MPWRNQYIHTRRHPLAIAVYLFTLLLGVFFLGDVFDSQAISATVGYGWQIAWEWLLTLGGATALAGVACPQRWLDEGLVTEGIGALSSAFGMGVYSIAVVQVAGWSVPVWAVFGVLAGGCLWRWAQTRADTRKLRGLVSLLADERRP